MVYGRHAAYNMILKQFSFFFQMKKVTPRLHFIKLIYILLPRHYDQWIWPV